MPGGVDSPVRSFRSVGGTPYTVARGEGAYVEDVDGNRYLDFVQSYGASLLGHAHPEVVKALREAVGEGTTFGAPTPARSCLAEAMTARVAGLEQVRLVSSGTEALMSAVRLARGVTRRDTIVKFDGCYHGHSDALLVAGGSGVAQMGLPGSAGVTAGRRARHDRRAVQRSAHARRRRRGGARRAGRGQYESRRAERAAFFGDFATSAAASARC